MAYSSSSLSSGKKHSDCCGCGNGISRLLSKNGSMACLMSWRSVLTRREPLLLVLDDYHLAQGAVLDRCLQFFLSHLPAGLAMFVTQPSAPGLAFGAAAFVASVTGAA